MNFVGRVLQTGRKWLETAGLKMSALQNRLSFFNGLAENSEGYRYTIPQRISEQSQRVTSCPAVVRETRFEQISHAHGALLPICDRPWQARRWHDPAGLPRYRGIAVSCVPV
jgi:hypothetical protein